MARGMSAERTVKGSFATEASKYPSKVHEAQQTRVWIAVILSLLLAEVGMHEFGHMTLAWAGTLAAVLLAAAGLAGWMYRKYRAVAWLVVSPLLGLLAATILSDAVGLRVLESLNLSGLVVLGTEGPDHGLLGVGHLLADMAVIAIGVYQLARWIRLRNTGTALGAAAAFTACCGTTAVLLAPALAALGSALGLAGIHVGYSLVVVAAVLTAAVAALGFALAGGTDAEEAASAGAVS